MKITHQLTNELEKGMKLVNITRKEIERLYMDLQEDNAVTGFIFGVVKKK